MSGAVKDDSDFVHLHVHTEYSMLDGAARIGDLFKEVSSLGQRAVAMTDHGYLFGAFDFWTQAQKYGVKPIIGLEAYMTPGTSRFDKTRVRWGDASQSADDVSARGAYTHLTVWARNNTGLHNLFRLGSYASLEGQMGKWPRMDMELLERFSDGLIGGTGCPSGEVQTRLRLGQYDKALEAAGALQDIFGKDNFYVELMNHGISIETRVLKDLLQISKEINAPLLATNDSHYVKREDAHSHDALLCINSGSTLNEPDRFKFDGDGYYIKSSQEMYDTWRELPEACRNTVEFAERCEVSFDTNANYMPAYPCPEGEDETSWFVKEVELGLRRRFPGGIPDKVRKQADYEVGVITQMGFPGYFLVVADFINWAKDNNIRVGPGRGSGAGSMAAYAMRITDLDPLEHGLIFERFLNPDRVSMPDFDVDFDERRRGEVIRYVTDKYGEDKVAQIVTYGTIKAKQALKDSTRLLGFPYALGEKLTKAMPPAIMGKDISLTGIFDPSDKRHHEAEEFRTIHKDDPDVQQVVELAKGIEGLKRQWGVHAAGVIMSRAPLIDVIPIMRRPQDGAVITQFDYPKCESLGLIKMDFLGLRNLTILDDALENIVKNDKASVELESLSLDDPATYELLGRGDTLGVFQLDGAGMRTLLRLMKPDNFEDISAVGALYRPGPMGANSHTNYALRKNSLQEVVPIHPELAEPLKDILDTTYGLIVYQEQVMAIAQKVAGYSLGQADILRRAMGKKKKEELDQQFAGFSKGMTDRGFSQEAVKTLWDILLPFSDYAFNKAHSAAYGVVSYWTAYLKANYPTEYMAALLTSVKDDKDKSALYLNECRKMGITVLPPDVNSSQGTFTPVGLDIRFGLSAIRNVGENVVEAIVKTREDKGDFESFSDFLNKVPATVCNKRTIESLIKAGAFDSLKIARRPLVLIHEQAIDAVIGVKRKEAEGQFDLFAGAGDEIGDDNFDVSIPDIPEWDKKQLLAFERDMLGLYVSDHPLSGLESFLAQNSEQSIATLVTDETKSDGHVITIAGLITAVQRKLSKQGNPWAAMTLEDLDGSIEIMFFGENYLAYSTALMEDQVVVIKGRIRKRDDQISLQAIEMTVPDIQSIGEDQPIRLTIAEHKCTPELITELRETLRNNPGDSVVNLLVQGRNKNTLLKASDEYRVRRSTSLFGDLKALLGRNCLN